METVIGTTAVGLATVVWVIGEVTPEPGNFSWIQFGAFGLCSYMVYFLCEHLKAKEKAHNAEREKFLLYLSRLAVILGNKPCLMKDREELNPQEGKE